MPRWRGLRARHVEQHEEQRDEQEGRPQVGLAHDQEHGHERQREREWRGP